MSFDEQNLERLKKFGRKLPKKIPNTQSITNKKTDSRKKEYLHKVETEENPEKLFHELMNISLDGNLPTHLIDRLKQIESSNNDNYIKDILNERDINNQSNQKNTNHYAEFSQLLLEEDESK